VQITLARCRSKKASQLPEVLPRYLGGGALNPLFRVTQGPVSISKSDAAFITIQIHGAYHAT
jgi:hypothetical protein